MLEFISAKDLLKTDNLITVTTDASLAQALAKLSSSHDAVFVVDDKRLLGLISPYHVLFHAKVPPQAKVKNCLFSPPKLKLHTKLPQIARQMVESKVYFLPVVSENDDWLGIVTRSRVLDALLSHPETHQVLQNLLKPEKVLTIKETQSLGEARHLMKQGGVSRLIVVDNPGTLRGILTRFDLREGFSIPKSSQKFLSRVGDKTKASRQEVRPYVKKLVYTASHTDPMSKILKLLSTHDIGSVVLVNTRFKPVGIISFRDILVALAGSQERQGRLNIFGNNFLQNTHAFQLLRQSFLRIKQKDNGISLDAFAKAEQNASGRTSRYQVSLIAKNQQRVKANAKTTAFSWKQALREAIEKIEAQI